MPRSIYKTSYGIALCRFNKEKNKRFEIIAIKKRYTYYYFSFVFGHYKKYNSKQLQYLFDNMTFGEKVDILSMKFSNMWYRLWLCDPETQYTAEKDKASYYHKKAKFEAMFLRDNGKRLKRLINNSSNASTIWEIPKGSRNKDENDAECAIREFSEESNIPPNSYTILWDVKPIIQSHKENNVIYRSVYYVAYLHKNIAWKPKVRFDTLQMSEVEQIKWISFPDIEFLNLNERAKKRFKTTFNQIKKMFKKNIKSYYY